MEHPNPQQSDGPGSACSGGLHGLLARWAELAPDECRQTVDGGSFNVATEEDGWTGPNFTWLGAADSLGVVSLDSYALTIGAVVYHAARRGFDLNLSVWGGEHFGGGGERPTRVKGAAARSGGALYYAHKTETPPNEGHVALQQLARTAVAAYLSALEAV